MIAFGQKLSIIGGKMKGKIESKLAFKLFLACALATTIVLELGIGASSSVQIAYCNSAEAKKMPIGCLNPDPGPAWYPSGGGTAGRPMIAYGIRI